MYRFKHVWHTYFSGKVQFSSIHEAVQHGDVVQLQAMVQQGAGLNDVDSKFKFTSLHWATQTGALEVNHTIYRFCIVHLWSIQFCIPDE